MTQSNTDAPVVQVAPQPNVYSVLLLLAIIALCTAVAVCMMSLLTPLADGGYGLEFGQLFNGTLPPSP